MKEVFINVSLDISVVVPVKNEEGSIVVLLEGLLNQSKKPKEIIIVDAGSTDSTLANITKFTPVLNRSNIQLRIESNPGGLPGGNRNLGVLVAGCEWIAFIDAGIVPAADWLEALCVCMADTRSKVVFGLCQYDGDTAFCKAVCAVSAGCGSRHAVLPASLFHRSVFDEVGYFREDLRAAEDLLWMRKVDTAFGSRVICNQAVVFYNQFPTDLNSVARKWSIYQEHVVRAGLVSTSTWLLMTIFIIDILILPIWPLTAAVLFSGYLLIRGILLPCIRSSKAFWWEKFPTAILIAPWIAIVMDGAKVTTLLLNLLNRKR